MELFSPRLVSNLPPRRFINQKPYLSCAKPALSLKRIPLFLNKSGLIYSATYLLRSTTSEETSTSITEQFDEESNKAISSEGQTTEEIHDVPISNKEAPFATEEDSISSVELLGEAHLGALQFLDGLKTKLNLGDAYPFFIYGSGVLLTLWISSAIIDAIESIPVFPRLLELVGFAFTVWFSYRYLIFKKNREELSAKLEELKRDVIGGSTEN